MPHPEHTPAPPNRTQTVRFGGALFTSEERDEETCYGYCNEYQPHAVKRMFDYKNEVLYDLRWDDAGNLGQVSMSKPGEMFDAGRFLFWTEDNRMHTAVNGKYYSYYAYDYGGERRLKLVGVNSSVDVNAEYMTAVSTLNEPTLYPSAYMVLTYKGYTKHYYAGTERVAARLGGGGLDALYPVIGNEEELQVKADMLFKQSLEQVNSRVLHENDLDCIMSNEFTKEEFGHPIEGIPYQMKADVECDHSQFKEMVDSMLTDYHNGEEKEVYFYHSDHLGSASWITDSAGIAVQHLQYLPYGEPYIDQRAAGTTYSERFRFTGKEKDEETGYGYFGARYMDHELMTMWLSVDPMADKYPSISSYNYCMWNPVKLVDPDGRDGRIILHNEGGQKTITIQTTIYLDSPVLSRSKLNNLAKNYNYWAKRELKPKTLNGVTVRFDVTYKVLEKSTELMDGDNVMSLNPNILDRSGTPCTKTYNSITGSLMEETTGSRSNINHDNLGPGYYKGVLHETCHLLGLSDRYYGYNTSFEGFEGDLMGGNPGFSSGLDETHYQNYIDYIEKQDMWTASYILLKNKIDIEYTNNLQHHADTPAPTIQ